MQPQETRPVKGHPECGHPVSKSGITLHDRVKGTPETRPRIAMEDAGDIAPRLSKNRAIAKHIVESTGEGR